MPHLVLLYSPNLEADTDITALCRALGLTLQIDEGPEVFDAKFGNLRGLFAKP